MCSWSGRYGRSKVDEVFRRLHDGDPVEIEKNFRCSSDNLVVSSRHYLWPARRCLCKGDYAKRFSPAPSTVCEMASGLFQADSLLAQERGKHRLRCACGQW